MKKRPGKHHDQATDIILNDKEMEKLVRQLVQKAHDRGACVSYLIRAISTVWKEQFHTEIKPKALNKKEKAFAKKVDQFLVHYENNLLEYSNEFYGMHHNYFNKDLFYQLLCSIYCTFENEDTITRELILKYAKEHGFEKPYYCSFMSDISFLYNFISDHLYFYCDKRLPTYSKDIVGPRFSIDSMGDYYSFTKQYVLSRTKTCKTAIMAIWLIEKYF